MFNIVSLYLTAFSLSSSSCSRLSTTEGNCFRAFSTISAISSLPSGQSKRLSMVELSGITVPPATHLKTVWVVLVRERGWGGMVKVGWGVQRLDCGKCICLINISIWNCVKITNTKFLKKSEVKRGMWERQGMIR